MKNRTRKHIDNLLEYETGRIDKKYGDISVLLLYPNTYYVGMSNLGFQTMYRMMNEIPNVRCERGFIFPDGEVLGMESGKTMSSYDIVAFSISFELDYPNVVEMLRAGNLPLYSSQRGENWPLVIAGGVTAMMNPEPIADFIDLFVIGEGEAIIPQFFDIFQNTRGLKKDEQLLELARLKGVYVPQFFEPEYNDRSKLIRITKKTDTNSPVSAQKPDLNEDPAHTTILTPETEFSSMFLIEISRGCTRGCRFCAARSAYHPFRFLDGKLVVELARQGMKHTKKIGLVGTVISDHPHIDFICDELISMGAKISVSSFRADSASETLIRSLAASGQRTITIAPEAGSEKLRKLIGKDMSDDSILSIAGLAKQHGIRFIKLYFIIGIPGETEEDLTAIPELAGRIREILPVKISINPFIPKPGTLFERKPMNTRSELQVKIRKLRKLLGVKRSVRVLPVSVRDALREGFYSRGGREISKYIAGETVPHGLIEETACSEIDEGRLLPWDVFDIHRGASTS